MVLPFFMFSISNSITILNSSSEVKNTSLIRINCQEGLWLGWPRKSLDTFLKVQPWKVVGKSIEKILAAELDCCGGHVSAVGSGEGEGGRAGGCVAIDAISDIGKS